VKNRGDEKKNTYHKNNISSWRNENGMMK